MANVVADDGPEGEVARAALLGQVEVATADLCDVEVASVLRKRWQQGSLSDERLDHAVADLLALPYPRFPSGPLLVRAMELRSNVTPYDGIYVALAEVLDATLVTGDGRLGRAPGVACAVEVLTADGLGTG